MFAEQYGPWAVIAGGSEGIGASFARKIAAHGVNLVLIARKPQPLEEVAHQIGANSKVQVRTLSIDLTRPDLLESVRKITDDIEVGLLIYNAGAETRMMPFVEAPFEGVQHIIRLNVIGTTTLCHHFAPAMRNRRRGGIILVGSMAGFAGSATIAAYSASKAFVQMFGESLWYELRPYDVNVLSLIVSSTRTPAMARMGLDFDSAPQTVMDPDDVAQEGLDNLANGPTWVPGAHNRQAMEMMCRPSRREVTEMMSAGSTAIAPARGPTER